MGCRRCAVKWCAPHKLVDDQLKNWPIPHYVELVYTCTYKNLNIFRQEQDISTGYKVGTYKNLNIFRQEQDMSTGYKVGTYKNLNIFRQEQDMRTGLISF